MYLSVPHGPDRYLLIAGYDSPQPVRWVGKVGEQSALFAGSCGKAHLAALPDPEIAALLESVELVAYTPNTIADKQALWDEIRRIRRQGYSVSYGERYADACGISVPIYNSYNCRGRAAAVLSVYLPMIRANRLNELVARAVAAADRITHLLQADGSAE